MEDKLAGRWGMCRRAGKLTTGFDAVTALAAEGRAALVLTASDLSEKTGKELRFALARTAAPVPHPDRRPDERGTRPCDRISQTGGHPGDGGRGVARAIGGAVRPAPTMLTIWRRNRPMMIKYRVSEVAKDFGVPSKEVIGLLAKYVDTPKKSATALEENELDLVFEYFTQKNSVENFDAYFATAAEKKEAEKAPAPEKADAATAAAPGSGSVCLSSGAACPPGRARSESAQGPCSAPSADRAPYRRYPDPAGQRGPVR